jgi:hypothetical protein
MSGPEMVGEERRKVKENEGRELRGGEMGLEGAEEMEDDEGYAREEVAVARGEFGIPGGLEGEERTQGRKAISFPSAWNG